MTAADDRSPTEVYRARDSIQAHMLKALLESRGVRALVVGDILETASRCPQQWNSCPKLIVAAADAERAHAILLESERDVRA